MEQLHNADKSEEASQLSPGYYVCLTVGLILFFVGIALLLPYVLEFFSEQIKSVTIKTNSALRYP